MYSPAIASKRFKEELKRYKKENNIKSNSRLVELWEKERKFSVEDFSRFSNGTRKLQEDDISFFSDKFGIRKEYLSGIDNFRTVYDFNRQRSIEECFRRLLINLGYADQNLDQFDENISFPPNTSAFLHSAKKELGDNSFVLCDVRSDSYVHISSDEMNAFIRDIVDYTTFKLVRYFNENAVPVPDAITESGVPLFRAHNEIKLKSKEPGIESTESLCFDLTYVPTASSNEKKIVELIDLYSIPPEE